MTNGHVRLIKCNVSLPTMLQFPVLLTISSMFTFRDISCVLQINRAPKTGGFFDNIQRDLLYGRMLRHKKIRREGNYHQTADLELKKTYIRTSPLICHQA